MPDANCQTEFQGSSNSSHSAPRDGLSKIPCSACRDLRPTHGPGSVLLSECLLKGCYICADIAKINDEISRTEQRLSNLFHERQKLTEKTRYMHDTIINRMPVEILSSIFVAVRDTLFGDKFQEQLNHVLNEPSYKQPPQSPPLLLGAVCKRWRDITLATPQLWIDITVNLTKSAEGQTDMIKNWGNRSGALPLDITIFPPRAHHLGRNLKRISSAVRSLAVRWNNIALSTPAYFCYRLLDGLEETPNINSLFLSELSGYVDQMKPQNPLRPRFLVSQTSYLRKIPFQWDRLKYVKITQDDGDDGDSDDDDDDDNDNALILDILPDAHNLRHCITTESRGGNTILPGRITNHSLTHLNIRSDVLRHLTLPSLSNLRYTPWWNIDEQCIDAILEFVDRSYAPLDSFTLAGYVAPGDPFPSFERLSFITHLSLDCDPQAPGFHNFLVGLSQPAPEGTLPRLKEISLSLCDELSAPSWLQVCELFRKVSQPNDAIGGPSVVFRRPFLKVKLLLQHSDVVDKDVFLCLLEAKNLGANLILTVGNKDWFDIMAKTHRVKL